MNVRTSWACVVVLLPLVLAADVADAAVQQYVETFSTTAFMDPANTTAIWDTGAGELMLPPFMPSIIGGYDTPSTAYNIEVAGNLAFVADYASGLQIIDITNPANPAFVGSFVPADRSQGVAVSGDLAFVADTYAGLRIIDIEDPANPFLVGSYPTSGQATAVVVAGDLAFVTDYASSLLIIDIANPASPGLVATYNTGVGAKDVVVDGDLAFVAVEVSGLQIIDITNPAAPAFVGSYNTPGFAQSIAVDGNLAYVADFGSGLQIIDITDPATPTLVGTFDTPGSAKGVAVNGDRAFVADYGAGLQVIDISDPASPSLLETLAMPDIALGVAVAGNFAFVADFTAGLKVVEFAVPAVPSLVSRTGLTGRATSVAIAGDLAVVAVDWAGIDIVDISDPAAPVVIGNCNTPGSPFHVVVSGDLALVAAWEAGLQIIDISNPQNPRLAASIGTSGNAARVAVAGDLAYVADGDLQVISISDPLNPNHIGTFPSGSNIMGVAISGDLAIVANLGVGIQVLDISDPSNPFLVSTYTVVDLSQGVLVEGDLVYATGYTSMLIISIANPAVPVLIGSHTVHGTDITIAGNLSFNAAFSSPYVVIDVTDPANPTPHGLISLPGDKPVGVAVAGDLAYVAMNDIDPWGGLTGELQVVRAFQADVTLELGEGRSLPIDDSSETIARVRLSSSQTAGVTWDISADGGVLWQAIEPDNLWTRIDAPGSDLVWRTTHAWTIGNNPTVADMQIEWVTQNAIIDAVSDVPDDQGGRVYVDWSRSGYDFADETALPVAGYNLYRRLDNPVLAAEVRRAGSPGTADASAWPSPDVPSYAYKGGTYITGSTAEATPASIPPGTWVLMGSAYATQSDSYRFEATTEADSSATGSHDAVYLITAHTTTPSVWFSSALVSGHSVDNIAPAVPTNVSLAYFTGSGNLLAWDPAPETDFQYFHVYRDTDPSFAPSPANLVHSTIATGWTDPDHDTDGVFYRITTLDHAGNESGPASAGTVTGAENPSAPPMFALHPNVPNPFNPSTLLRFDVPAGGGRITLAIYDVGGRLIDVLIDGVQPAGTGSIAWNGRDEVGRAVPAGVYLARLVGDGRLMITKMMLVR